MPGREGYVSNHSKMAGITSVQFVSNTTHWFKRPVLTKRKRQANPCWAGGPTAVLTWTKASVRTTSKKKSEIWSGVFTKLKLFRLSYSKVNDSSHGFLDGGNVGLEMTVFALIVLAMWSLVTYPSMYPNDLVCKD